MLIIFSASRFCLLVKRSRTFMVQYPLGLGQCSSLSSRHRKYGKEEFQSSIQSWVGQSCASPAQGKMVILWKEKRDYHDYFHKEYDMCQASKPAGAETSHVTLNFRLPWLRYKGIRGSIDNFEIWRQILTSRQILTPRQILTSTVDPRAVRVYRIQDRFAMTVSGPIWGRVCSLFCFCF